MNLGYVFKSCYSLPYIIIPANASRILEGTFYDCCSLRKITIPKNVTNIGNNAFYGCSALREVHLKSTNPPTLGQDVFAGSHNLKFYVPIGSIGSYKAATGWSTYANQIFEDYE